MCCEILDPIPAGLRQRIQLFIPLHPFGHLLPGGAGAHKVEVGPDARHLGFDLRDVLQCLRPGSHIVVGQQGAAHHIAVRIRWLTPEICFSEGRTPRQSVPRRYAEYMKSHGDGTLAPRGRLNYCAKSEVRQEKKNWGLPFAARLVYNRI